MITIVVDTITQEAGLTHVYVQFVDDADGRVLEKHCIARDNNDTSAFEAELQSRFDAFLASHTEKEAIRAQVEASLTKVSTGAAAKDEKFAAVLRTVPTEEKLP